MTKYKYPEHLKIEENYEQSNVCEEFFDWILKNFIIIDKNEKNQYEHIQFGYSSQINSEKVLADYFGIDYEKLKDEEEQIIRDMMERI